jgi:hypothetical protein
MIGEKMHKQNSDKQQDYTDPELLQEALYQLLEQISKRDQKILSIMAEKTAVTQELMEKEKIIAERDASLLFTQGEMDKMLKSKAWKIASMLIQTRTFLFPPDSRRAQALDKALNVIFFPFRKAGRS